jgi:hypothetical protein
MALSTQDEPGTKRTVSERRSVNHFELAFTNYEFLLDFGQAYDPSEDALIHTRMIMTPRNAMTLSKMLAELVEQYKTQASEAAQEIN